MKKILNNIFLMIMLFVIPVFCFGASGDYNNFGLNSSNLQGKFGTAEIPTIAGNMIKIVIGLSATVMLIMILWSGIELMFSSGDVNKRKKAINRIVWTSVGIIIIVSAYAISQFVINQINFLST